MSIHRLKPEDAAAYRALRLRAFREHPEAFTSSYEEEALKPVEQAAQRLASESGGRYWGAFVNGILVGMVGLDFEPRIKNRHKAVVVGMYVAPEFAREGLARNLLDTLLDYARQSSLELLVLTVTHGNKGAEQLYLKAGFQPFGIEPNAIKVKDQYFDKMHMFMQLKLGANTDSMF